jgi:hypothetical protein
VTARTRRWRERATLANGQCRSVLAVLVDAAVVIERQVGTLVGDSAGRPPIGDALTWCGDSLLRWLE